MTKSKFYAVKKGLRPGVYRTWAECQEQTQGVSGAAFKSFSTQQAADQYLEGGTALLQKKRTHSQSRAMRKGAQSNHPGQSTEAVCALQVGVSAHDREAGGGAQASADRRHHNLAGVPAWIQPDRMYRLVTLSPCSLLKRKELNIHTLTFESGAGV